MANDWHKGSIKYSVQRTGKEGYDIMAHTCNVYLCIATKVTSVPKDEDEDEEEVVGGGLSGLVLLVSLS